RGAHAGIPPAMGRAQPVADVRQLDLPGPPLPAPADAVAGAVFPLPQPGREHDQGTRAPLGAGGAGRRAQGGVAHRAERRARLDRGAEALPHGDGCVRRAALARPADARAFVGAAEAASFLSAILRHGKLAASAAPTESEAGAWPARFD